MNKVVAFILIIITLYLVAVFVVPETADTLAKKIGIEKLNTTLRGAKTVVDNTNLKLPEASGGIIDIYQETVNSAKDATNQALEQGKQVKEKIDTVRSTLSGAQDTIDKTIETANTVIETGKEIQKKVGEVKQTLDEVSELGNSVKTLINTGATK